MLVCGQIYDKPYELRIQYFKTEKEKIIEQAEREKEIVRREIRKEDKRREKKLKEKQRSCGSYDDLPF